MSLTQEEMQTIRYHDDASGVDLQGCPPAWTHRRQLLAHVASMEEAQADHDKLVRELDTIINGDGAAPQARLCDIVTQLRCLRPSWSEPPAVEGCTYSEAEPTPTWKCSTGVLHMVGCPCDCRSEGCSLSL